MATDAQIAANRQNVRSSTGPTSLAAKGRSSRNAMRHGLTAEKLLLTGEDAELFDDLLKQAIAYFQPQGLECDLVERIAGLLWRLRRAAGFEALLFNTEEADSACSLETTKLLSPELTRSPLAQALCTVLREDLLSKLGRYERGFAWSADRDDEAAEGHARRAGFRADRTPVA